MVKVGDIITVTSARWGDEKARVIGGDRQGATRWKLEMLRSNKIRYVDKDKVPEQVVEPKKKIIKKKPKPDDSSQVSQSSQVSVSEPTKKFIKKPKPPDMLQTIDLSSMPSVNSGVSEEISELIQSAKIKDEEERKRQEELQRKKDEEETWEPAIVYPKNLSKEEIRKIIDELDSPRKDPSKPDRPYFYRGYEYTASWGVYRHNPDKGVLLDNEGGGVVAQLSDDGEVIPIRNPVEYPKLYTPSEIVEYIKGPALDKYPAEILLREEIEYNEVAKYVPKKDMPNLRELYKRKKEEQERKRQEEIKKQEEPFRKEYELLNTMNKKEKIEFLIGKDLATNEGRTMFDIEQDKKRYISRIRTLRERVETMINKNGTLRDGTLPEKLPRFGRKEVEGLPEYDVGKKEIKKGLYEYILIPGEAHETLKKKMNEYEKRWSFLIEEYDAKKQGELGTY